MESNEQPQNVRRNFGVLAANFIVMRVGWIFKTEAVVMPGFLDSLGAGAAARGWLIVINRLGQSVPQFLIAHHIAGLSRLKSWYVFLSILNALPWGVLAFLVPAVIGEGDRARILQVFIVSYAVYWLLFGTVRIFDRTTQGKVLPYNIRGRLISVSGAIGGLLAVIAALLLMAKWLGEGQGRFDLIFLFIFVCFGASALVLIGLVETPREEKDGEDAIRFRDTVEVFLSDREFRKLLVCAMFASSILLLFPHLAVFGRRELGLGITSFAMMVVYQNIFMAAISIVVGWLADRHGNRLAFQLLTFGLCTIPVAAILLVGMGETGRKLYPLMFGLVGFTPVSQRILANYVLEMAPQEKHAQYLATLQMAIIIPLLFSPLAGNLAEVFSYEAVFLVINVILVFGALMPFWLKEPRHRKADEASPQTPKQLL